MNVELNDKILIELKQWNKRYEQIMRMHNSFKVIFLSVSFIKDIIS